MAVLALVVAVSVLLAIGSVWLTNKTVYQPGNKEQSSSVSPFLTTVALVYGALLGFTVVVAWEQFSSAEINVTNESSTLATMYRQTVSMPAPEQTKMRELLRGTRRLFNTNGTGTAVPPQAPPQEPRDH
jgi:hypothetical protein